ncbi:hypothetical protein NDU88_004377 [Pleurodeles waltl]|uniref:Uncharacterized protein n=1 Tax=Pleurodeles waltl TaxID=8319 RepID=A0AAV7LUF8_PLEWA|nr:hypothetical protein NDU88_004377 [Pleurodeles waltl]
MGGSPALPPQPQQTPRPLPKVPEMGSLPSAELKWGPRSCVKSLRDLEENGSRGTGPPKLLLRSSAPSMGTNPASQSRSTAGRSCGSSMAGRPSGRVRQLAEVAAAAAR